MQRQVASGAFRVALISVISAASSTTYTPRTANHVSVIDKQPLAEESSDRTLLRDAERALRSAKRWGSLGAEPSLDHAKTDTKRNDDPLTSFNWDDDLLNASNASNASNTSNTSNASSELIDASFAPKSKPKPSLAVQSKKSTKAKQEDKWGSLGAWLHPQRKKKQQSQPQAEAPVVQQNKYLRAAGMTAVASAPPTTPSSLEKDDNIYSQFMSSVRRGELTDNRRTSASNDNGLAAFSWGDIPLNGTSSGAERTEPLLTPDAANALATFSLGRSVTRWS
eukprot:gnl/TRDRNA2_/TRDRNA2_187558_c0_seq1.p1 gnl/TRDRNA2_/TRDRNA2_187558_c0~~gnl/TRDRNA2_/TRDRNA2_187558_c0_seq1.p1  ORF type:complete len:294 (-),score=65.70 gnl/TRDRNA2_/TRDRNA2_187558_c0_seq1:78-917(-)